MTISSTTVRNSYNGDGSTATFTYTFKIFANTDLQVIIRSALGTETVKTLTTHYTVTGAGSASGGDITFTAGNIPISGETIVLRRAIPQTQAIDYIANDPFPAESHEEGLDRATMSIQQLQEEVNRSLKLSRTNTMNSTEFTVGSASRANKVLAFDTSGELSVAQELGQFQGNWTAGETYAARDIVKDTSNNNIYLCNTGHTASGTTPISSNADVAKWDLLVDAYAATASAAAASASASAAATSESNAATSASNASSSASSAASSLSSTQTIFDNFDDRFLGTKTSDPTLDNDGDALLTGVIYYNSNTDELKVYNGTTWDAPTTQASNSATSAASSASTATTQAGIATTQAGNASTSASNAATSESNASASASTATTQATNAAASASTATTQATNASNSATTATTQATNASNSATAAAASAASAASLLDTFDDTYLGAKATDPTLDNDGDVLNAGDLYYNTSAGNLKYYDGSVWIAITSGGITDVVQDGTPQLGGNLDVNGNSIVSVSNGNINITPNGTGSVILDGLSYPQADGTANQVLKTDGSGSLSFTTLQGGNITTEGDYFSNYNSITSNVTTTTASNKNSFLKGAITVNSGFIWTISGTGSLDII